MFIKKYEKGTINPFALPGLLNDFRMNLRPELMYHDLGKYLEVAIDDTGKTVEQVMSKSRKREVVLVRQAYCYIAKKYSKMSLNAIGKYIGGRDHTTVIHSISTIKDLMDTDEAIRNYIHKLESKINFVDRPNDLIYSVIGSGKCKAPVIIDIVPGVVLSKCV